MTTSYTLTIVDTTGIQGYVFGSNQLRENTGASELVYRATHTFVTEILGNAPWHWQGAPNTLHKQKAIEEHADCHAEIIYLGGGNALLLFRTPELATQFASALSKRVLCEAPGLELAIVHLPCAWGTDVLGGDDGIMKKVYATLAAYKQHRPRSAPAMGLGVTLACRSTGLPATAHHPDETTRLISASVAAKVGKLLRKGGEKRLKKELSFPETYAIPRRFDDLGRSRDDNSYIAVVHIDGNGMGKLFEEVGKAITDNRKYITAIRTLSESVKHASQVAFADTVKYLVEGLALQDSDPRHQAEMVAFCENLPQDEETGNPYLPLRPLVYGGDDVTFVCDGRIGLPLALKFLAAFEQHTEAHPNIPKRLTACAGIAIVKSHYPFARAYALAEDLCQNAKRFSREQQGASALDWHVLASGAGDDLATIREREYQVKRKTLTTRPVYVDTIVSKEVHAWETIASSVLAFKYTDRWTKQRNKVMALRDQLRAGDEATKAFVASFVEGGQLPETPVPSTEPLQTGYEGNTCLYFDAIELLDFYLPLEPVLHGNGEEAAND